MMAFIIIAGIHAVAFFIVTIQLFIAKPTSLKVIIPIILITASAFFLLIAIDFFIEYHHLHVSPRDKFTKDKLDDDNLKKKKGKGFKMGFLIIYINMCVVAWLIYLAYKYLEEELDNEEYEDEPMEITISHIT